MYILYILSFFFILMVIYLNEITRHPKLKKIIYAITIVSTVVTAFWQTKYIDSLSDFFLKLILVLILAILAWFVLNIAKIYPHYDAKCFVISLNISKALLCSAKIVAGILIAALLLSVALS